MNSTNKKVIMFSALVLGVGVGVTVYFMQKELKKDSDARSNKLMSDIEKGHPDDDLFPLSLSSYNKLATSQKKRASVYIKKLQKLANDKMLSSPLWQSCYARRMAAQDGWDKKFNISACQKNSTRDCENELKIKSIDGKFTRRLEKLLNSLNVPSSIDNRAMLEQII